MVSIALAVVIENKRMILILCEVDCRVTERCHLMSLISLGGSGIRNHANGWVYTRAEILPSEELLSSSIEAVKLLGLNFGAVDIGHRLIDNKLFVFEVNTAPGLEGTTLDKYSKAIYNYYKTIT